MLNIEKVKMNDLILLSREEVMECYRNSIEGDVEEKFKEIDKVLYETCVYWDKRLSEPEEEKLDRRNANNISRKINKRVNKFVSDLVNLTVSDTVIKYTNSLLRKGKFLVSLPFSSSDEINNAVVNLFFSPDGETIFPLLGNERVQNLLNNARFGMGFKQDEKILYPYTIKALDLLYGNCKAIDFNINDKKIDFSKSDDARYISTAIYVLTNKEEKHFIKNLKQEINSKGNIINHIVEALRALGTRSLDITDITEKDISGNIDNSFKVDVDVDGESSIYKSTVSTFAWSEAEKDLELAKSIYNEHLKGITAIDSIFIGALAGGAESCSKRIEFKESANGKLSVANSISTEGKKTVDKIFEFDIKF